MDGIKSISAKLSGEKKRFAIVVSRFNEFISGKLLEGACDCLIRHSVNEKDITVVWVPGSFEVPLTARKMAKTGNFDAVICLGAILRGQTPHFDYVAQEAAKGVAKVSMDSDLPCVFGMITADNLEQAIERAGTKSGNKGRDAALVAIEMADLLERL